LNSVLVAILVAIMYLHFADLVLGWLIVDMIKITLESKVAMLAVAECDMNKRTVIILASATLIVEFALGPMCKTTPLAVLACLVLCPVPAELLDGFGAMIQTTRQSEAGQTQQSLDHFQFLPILQSVP
jgi:hypothetical protein